MTNAKHAKISGTWFPDFALPNSRGVATRFYGHAGGRPTVLALYRQASGFGQQLPRLWQVLQSEYSGPLDRFLIHDAQPDAGPVSEDALPSFLDPEGRLLDLLGESSNLLVVCDPGLRVLGVHECADPEASAQSIAMLLHELPTPPAQEIALLAPVLTLPQVLPEGLCHQLLDRWQREHASTGVETSHQGRRQEQLAASHKRRKDHVVQDAAMHKLLASTIGRCVIPKLHQLYGVSMTRFEGFKIACYDASDAGFFSPHRDNLSPATQHRRFALSLLLNDDYQGGALRFPEFGPHRYRPPAGAALLFSCHMLHEVLPVTAGQRFVLLSFLFGEEEAKRRSAHRAKGAPHRDDDDDERDDPME